MQGHAHAVYMHMHSCIVTEESTSAGFLGKLRVGAGWRWCAQCCCVPLHPARDSATRVSRCEFCRSLCPAEWQGGLLGLAAIDAIQMTPRPLQDAEEGLWERGRARSEERLGSKGCFSAVDPAGVIPLHSLSSVDHGGASIRLTPARRTPRL